MKQIIIARKDLNMSPGKLAAQVSHASMAFLTNAIKANGIKRLNEGYSVMPVFEYVEIKPEKREEHQKILDNIAQKAKEAGRDEYFPQEIVERHDKLYIKRPMLYKHPRLYQLMREALERGDTKFYIYHPTEYHPEPVDEVAYHIESTVQFDLETWDDWINGSFAKVVCEAKNRYQLEKVYGVAANLGLEQGKDYFLIKDNCLTELTPEEFDANGVGRTLTCVGFRPLPDDIANKISHKYQLYK